MEQGLLCSARMKALTPLFLALFLSLGPPAAHAIINGSDADPVKSASSVFLSFPDRAETRCTGVIVNSHLILTAGHCFDDISAGMKSIKISNYSDGDSNLKNIELAKPWARHPLYIKPAANGEKKSLDIQNDIAYINTTNNLLEEFELAEKDLPKLFTNTEALTAALMSQPHGMAYGYGLTTVGNNPRVERENKKKELPVSLVLDSELNVIIVRSRIEDRGLCKGDSGGGIYTELNGETYVVGILSGVDGGCGTKDAYAAYSSISRNLCWISQDSGLLGDLNLNCNP